MQLISPSCKAAVVMSCLVAIFVITITFSINNVDSVIIQQRPSQQINNDIVVNSMTSNHDPYKKYHREYIFSTTLDHIKLYPYFNLNVSSDYYLLKTTEPEFSLENLIGLSEKQIPYYKWLLTKHLKANETKKASILPGEMLEEYYSSTTQYFKPQIVDVDYFYTRNCRGWQSRYRDPCLVIVWLDIRNQLIQYGSISITKLDSIIENQKNGSSRGEKTIWLQPYPPIGINHISTSKRIDGMIVDKRNKRVNVLYSTKKADNTTITRVFSHNLYTSQLSSEELSNINLKPSQGLEVRDCPVEYQDDIGNANKDDTRTVMDMNAVGDGYWLFYRSRYDNNEIHTLSVYEKWSELGRGALHVSFNAKVVCLEEVIAMTVDIWANRLLLLTSRLELYSFNFVFNDKQLLGKISLNRPNTAFNQFKMQYNNGILFVSDLTRKSVSAYNIGATESEEGFQGNTTFTRQVILVETPHLAGFRFIESYYEPYTFNLVNKETETMTQVHQDNIVESYKNISSGDWFQKFYIWFLPPYNCIYGRSYDCAIMRFINNPNLTCSSPYKYSNDGSTEKRLCRPDEPIFPFFNHIVFVALVFALFFAIRDGLKESKKIKQKESSETVVESGDRYKENIKVVVDKLKTVTKSQTGEELFIDNDRSKLVVKGALNTA